MNTPSLLECSSWTARLNARFRAGQQTMPTHLGFDQPSLTIDSLAAQRLEGWRSPLTGLFASMLLSPFPFGIRLGCALTTAVLVVLTLDQQGDEEHNGAQ